MRKFSVEITIIDEDAEPMLSVTRFYTDGSPKTVGIFVDVELASVPDTEQAHVETNVLPWMYDAVRNVLRSMLPGVQLIGSNVV